MENEQDKKGKDKQIPQEELFGDLDAMYQRDYVLETNGRPSAFEPGRETAAGRFPARSAPKTRCPRSASAPASSTGCHFPGVPGPSRRCHLIGARSSSC